MVFVQENARKALDVLWERRQKGSDLVGTVINIHNEEWVRRGEATFTYTDSVHTPRASLLCTNRINVIKLSLLRFKTVESALVSTHTTNI